MPGNQFSSKEFAARQRRVRDLPPNVSDALQQMILPLPTTDAAKEDPRLVQWGRIFFPHALAFTRVGADEIGRRDCASEIAEHDRDRSPQMVLREPTNGHPAAFPQLVHSRLAYYSMLVLSGDLGPEMLRIAVEQEAAWKKRGDTRPRLLVEPLPPWAERGLELHGCSFLLGPEFVLERATRAVKAGIRGILCAPDDVPVLRPHFPIYPAEGTVRILVDGVFDPAREPPKGYTRPGTYEAAMAAGADGAFIQADIWSTPDPFEAILAIAQQMAAGRAKFRPAR